MTLRRHLTLDDLAATEIGDWKMPDFKAACSHAASQGWLIVEGDILTLTTVGLRASDDRCKSQQSRLLNLTVVVQLTVTGASKV
jgi:hypothetical protein